MTQSNAGRKERNNTESLAIIFICSALFASTLTAYWNSFNAPFVFDDLATIQRNAQVRFGEFGWNLISPRAVLYKTFTFNYLLAGQEVWSYHLVNFILHFLNGLLIFVIATRVFRSLRPSPYPLPEGEGVARMYAALAAAFFLLHPVQTESVTYISSRSELLSTFFYLIGFLTFVLWPKDRAGFYCSLAVGTAYFFGLGSKEPVVTLPAAIFLYDYLFLSHAEFRPVFSRWRFYLVYLAGTSAAIVYVLTKLKSTVGGMSSWQYFLTETRVLVRYIQLIFFPVGLNLDYDFKLSSKVFEPAVLGSIALLVTLVLFGWGIRRKEPVFAFSIFWFFLTLSPTSSVVPIIDVVFEHRLYLPLAGVALCFPFLIDFLYTRLWRPVARPSIVFACSSVILIALLAGTVMRNNVWSDEVRLFTDVVAKSPHKERPYNNLAWAYFKRAEYDRAIAVLEQAFNRMPENTAELSDTLGNMYLKAGQYDKAIALFQKTTHSLKDGMVAVAYNNLGVAYLYEWTDLQNHRSGISNEEFEAKKEEILRPAAEAFSESLEVDPNMPSSLDSYINVMCYRGKGSEIERAALEKVTSAKNFDLKQLNGKEKLELFSALYTIGKVAFNNGDYAKANTYFERAEQVKDDVRIVYFNHGYALTMLQQDERAAEKYVNAIRIDPIFIEAHHNLGLIYMRRKDYSKAVEAFTEVLRLDPKQVSSNLNLASIYMAEGQKDRARRHLSTVLAVAPDNQQAAAMLRQLGL